MLSTDNAELFDQPETGSGPVRPLCGAESLFNRFTASLLVVSSALLIIMCLGITFDVIGRSFFGGGIPGLTDLETLAMSAIGFLALAYPITNRASIQIDLFYNGFASVRKRRLYCLASVLACAVTAVLGWRAIAASLDYDMLSEVLDLPKWPSLMLTGVCMILASIAFLFQVIHIVRDMILRREILGILFAVAAAALIISLPFAYKAAGCKFSGLVIGGIGFMILMILMLLRVPLGYTMALIGLLGLIAISRRPMTALRSVSVIPFTQTATFIMIAFPMFMLMGEMVSLAGLSADLFDVAKKWLGRLPGGLACAAVGGCAGFGAVCGDSFATVITMSAVAMPAMESNDYDQGLSCGAIAAGGTLGILIPPSMGFIIYSMITEASVGKLFIAGVLPGLLLAAIFMAIIVVNVLRHPEWAPKAPAYPLKDKLISLLGLGPVIVLFLVVVIGILQGWFTPAEGGAVGATMAFCFALLRKKVTWASFKKTLRSATVMFGKMFGLFLGLYILGAFLAGSRLPDLLAETVVSLNVSRYLILFAVIVLYIILGCVMNIIPMMMLTLPSIYPTLEALGFDLIWFGVVCVIVMEMGMITPPVGMNVFTLATLQEHISMSTMFKGVLPFFAGMILCVLLIILFPQIALVLVN